MTKLTRDPILLVIARNNLEKAEAMVRAVRDRGLPHASSETASVVTISMGTVVTIPGPDRTPQ